MKFNFLILLFFLIQLQAFSQQSPTEDYRLISPYQTVMTHIKNMKSDHYHPEIAAKVFNPKQVSAEEAVDMAVQLMQIYKGAGVVFSFEDVSPNPNYLDSLSGRNVYVLHNLSSILKQCDLIRCDTLIFDCRLFWHEGISNKS
ncbi:MAG: hypothetical protein HC819_21635 [Cyclobacteriaceae bacterium]|nr:hypothetical protein [Cyclobacteriaceae bacterium]